MSRFAGVQTLSSLPEAELARGQLVAAGVRRASQAVGVLPLHRLALGGVRLVVEATEAPPP